MKKNLKLLDYDSLIHNEIREDSKIGDQIFLMGDYQLLPIRNYRFVAPENIFIEVYSGKGYVSINGEKHIVDGHCLLAYLKGQEVEVCITSRKTIQHGVAFSDEFMENLYLSAIKFNDIRTSVILNPVLKLNDEQEYGLKIYALTLKAIASMESNPNGVMCIKMATLALFYGPLYETLRKKLEAETTRSPLISTGFFKLLEENFKTEHNLTFYADALNVSKTYLYQCVTSTSGKSPGYWIDYYMISFAKKNLADMDLSILQIARELNYSGLPQFSKFFKKQTGMSPRDYRNSLL